MTVGGEDGRGTVDPRALMVRTGAEPCAMGILWTPTITS
jgi:hypothetical protein